MTLRERLDRRGLRPATVERTEKHAGDIVIKSWCLPVVKVMTDEQR